MRAWERYAIAKASQSLVDALLGKGDWRDLYRAQSSSDPSVYRGVLLAKADADRLDRDWLTANGLACSYEQRLVPQGFWLREVT